MTNQEAQLERDQYKELGNLPISTMLNYLIETGHIAAFKTLLASAINKEIEVSYDVNAIKQERIIAYLINVFYAKVLQDKLAQIEANESIAA